MAQSSRTVLQDSNTANKKELNLVVSNLTPSVVAVPVVNPDGSNVVGPAIPSNVFRDGFSTQDATKWNFTNIAASDLLYNGGNAASASWLSIVKSALVADTYSEIVSLNSYPMSLYAAAGLTLSQRIMGQAFAFEFVGVDGNGNIINNNSVADIALSNTNAVVTSTNIVTFTSSSAHGLIPGDPIVLFGCGDSRLNMGPVVVSGTPTSTTFTVTSPQAISNGNYAQGAAGMVRFAPADNYASYLAALHWNNVTVTNTDTVTKNGDRQPETVTVGFPTTNATIPNENGINYTNVAYAFPQRPSGEYVMRLHNKFAQLLGKTMDSTAVTPNGVHRSENIPDNSRQYKVRFRARNFPNHAIPVGYIKAAAKSGSTTATLTIPNHGLTTSDWIQIWNIRDQTNFTNQSTAVQVASVIDANNITVVFGASATATSYGGFVFRVQGQQNLPALTASAIQTYAKTSDGQRLSIVFGAAQNSLIIPGEIWTLYGLVDSTNTAQTALFGRYQVALSNTTNFTVELVPMDGQNLTGVSTTPANAGGGVIRNTEFRLHYFRTETETPQTTEIMGGVGDNDLSSAPTVNPAGANVNVLINGGNQANMAAQSTNKIAGVAPGAVISATDRASAALTASGNSGTIANDFGAAMSALISVTANSGTGQRMDVALQESFDNGSTWQDIWHCPRFTNSNVAFAMPYMLIGGRRRWNYTVGGSSPSFTFAITAMMGSLPPSGVLRQFFDYTSAAGGTVNVNSLNSATPTYFVEGCKEFTVNISMASGGSGAPVFQLQTSPDGTNWFNVGSTITGTASTNQTLNIANNPARYARILVSTAGTSAVCNYVNLIGR